MYVKVKTDTTAPANDKARYVYAWGVADPSSPIYPDRVTGADPGSHRDAPHHTGANRNTGI